MTISWETKLPTDYDIISLYSVQEYNRINYKTKTVNVQIIVE